MKFFPPGLNQKRDESHRRGYRIPEELQIARLVQQGQAPKAMYDLGVGCFSEFRTLKAVWPEMALFGCEPCREEYEDVRPIFDGQLLQVAVGAENGWADLFKTPVGIGGSTLLPGTGQGRGSRPEERVEVWTLDRFDEWAGKPKKILLWADVEGSELDVLRGGAELLRSGRVWWINLESRDVSPGYGHPSTQELDDHLRPLGYRKVHRYNVQGAYPEAPGDTIWFRDGVPHDGEGSYEAEARQREKDERLAREREEKGK